jgi:hypothetical protein
VSNIAARILIWTHKFWTANKTLSPLCIFVSRNPWHPFAEPSWRNSVLREYIVWMFLRLQCWVVCRGLREEVTGGWGKCILKRFINYSYYRLVGCDTLCFGNETYCRHFEGWINQVGNVSLYRSTIKKHISWDLSGQADPNMMENWPQPHGCSRGRKVQNYSRKLEGASCMSIRHLGA